MGSGRTRERDARKEDVMKPAAHAARLPSRWRTKEHVMRSWLRFVALALFIAVGLRCSEAPTQPNGQTPAPTTPPGQTPAPTTPPGQTPAPTTPPGQTPTPTTPPNLNGEWSGTLTYGTYFYGGCCASCPDESIRVQLYFADLRISGHFGTRCVGTIYVEGTLGGPDHGTGRPITVDLWSAGEEKLAGRLEGHASSAAIYVSSRATVGATKLSLSR